MPAPPPAMKSQGMTFAEKQLQRHGWTEGKGLGRRENGISEAIKVKVKCDTAGVGHNSAEQFTFHWWDHVFNKTASSISVESDQGGVQVKKISEDETTVTNKKPRKALANRDMLYGRFIKSATLLSGGETPVEKEPSSESSDSSGDEDEKLDLSSARKLTDEDLVKICGGRTAHKGARHGLTMSAKLSRIEEQERAFLEKYAKPELKNAKPNGDPSSASTNASREKINNGPEAMDEAALNISCDTTWVKKKKKKRKKSSGEEDVMKVDEKTKLKDKSSKKKRAKENVGLLEDVLDHAEDIPTSKKKKCIAEVTDDLSDHAQFTDDVPKGSKKKKKKKPADEENSEMVNNLDDQAASAEDVQPRKKKKKTKCIDNEVEGIEEASYDPQGMGTSGEETQKKKKKRTNVNLGDHEHESADERVLSKTKKNKIVEAEYREYVEDEDSEDLKKKKKKKSKTSHCDQFAEEAVDDSEHPKCKRQKDKS